MGGVAPIVPICKLLIISLKVRHDRQCSTWPQQSIKLLKLGARVMKVLHDFSAGNEVIVALQRIGIRKEDRVIDLHGVPSVAQDVRERWTWSAAVIKALLRGGQSLQQWIGNALQERTVCLVVRIIVVLRVARLFISTGRQVRVCQQRRLARSAAPVGQRVNHGKRAQRAASTHPTSMCRCRRERHLNGCKYWSGFGSSMFRHVVDCVMTRADR